jgi:type VI secretion system secreted protein Hcp
VDLASTSLMSNIATGKHIPSAVLTLERVGGATARTPYMKITLTDVLVTSLSTGGSGGETRLTENISLNYRTIKVEYWQQKADGSTVLAGTFNWDLAAATTE